MSSLAIEASGLVKHFGQTRAVDGIDLDVATGEVLGLLGPNGAGKTTVVRILATLTEPDHGQVQVGGYDLASQAHQIRSVIGLTGQYASVDNRLTGSENLALIGRLLGLPRREARTRTKQLLAQFELQEAAHRPVQGFSGGMRRRLDLAASLIGNPRILFLDEPTTGLDPRARRQLWALIRARVEQGLTVLLTTQYLDEADALADRIMVIDHGKVIAGGSPDELKERMGARTLTIRPQESDDHERLAGLLMELTGSEPERQAGRLSVPVRDSALLPELIRRMDQMNMAAQELSLRSASLDEVFLALTGHPASSEEAEQEDAS